MVWMCAGVCVDVLGNLALGLAGHCRGAVERVAGNARSLARATAAAPVPPTCGKTFIKSQNNPFLPPPAFPSHISLTTPFIASCYQHWGGGGRGGEGQTAAMSHDMTERDGASHGAHQLLELAKKRRLDKQLRLKKGETWLLGLLNEHGRAQGTDCTQAGIEGWERRIHQD